MKRVNKRKFTDKETSSTSSTSSNNTLYKYFSREKRAKNEGSILKETVETESSSLSPNSSNEPFDIESQFLSFEKREEEIEKIIREEQSPSGEPDDEITSNESQQISTTSWPEKFPSFQIKKGPVNRIGTLSGVTTSILHKDENENFTQKDLNIKPIQQKLTYKQKGFIKNTSNNNNNNANNLETNQSHIKDVGSLLNRQYQFLNSDFSENELIVLSDQNPKIKHYAVRRITPGKIRINCIGAGQGNPSGSNEVNFVANVDGYLTSFFHYNCMPDCIDPIGFSNMIGAKIGILKEIVQNMPVIFLIDVSNRRDLKDLNEILKTLGEGMKMYYKKTNKNLCAFYSDAGNYFPPFKIIYNTNNGLTLSKTYSPFEAISGFDINSKSMHTATQDLDNLKKIFNDVVCINPALYNLDLEVKIIRTKFNGFAARFSTIDKARSNLNKYKQLTSCKDIKKYLQELNRSIQQIKAFNIKEELEKIKIPDISVALNETQKIKFQQTKLEFINKIDSALRELATDYRGACEQLKKLNSCGQRIFDLFKTHDRNQDAFLYLKEMLISVTFERDQKSCNYFNNVTDIKLMELISPILESQELTGNALLEHVISQVKEIIQQSSLGNS